MLYLLATIGALVIAIMVWRSFGEREMSVHSAATRSRPLAPDDDPEFLQRLDDDNRRRYDG